MKRLFSVLAAAGAFSLGLAMVPSIGSAAAMNSAHHITKITTKQTGTVVEKAGSRTITMHFNSAGKLVSATETGGAHGMTPAALTVGHHAGPKGGAHGYYAVCYSYVCDYYGYCYYYYYYC